MNEYANLLALLIERTTITIRATVTAPAIRKGLAEAKRIHNMNAGILELEEFHKSFSITKATTGKGEAAFKVTAVDELVDESTSGKSKFSFELVDDTKNGDKEDGSKN